MTNYVHQGKIEFTLDPYQNFEHLFSAKEKINGQTVEVLFRPFERNGITNGVDWEVELHIYTKRKSKDVSYTKQTGKIGIKGLLFSKKAILQFEHFIVKKQPNHHHRICIAWADSQRKRVYMRGLRDEGYKYVMIYECNFMALVKELN